MDPVVQPDPITFGRSSCPTEFGLKINFKKNIILMYLLAKNTLKCNFYFTSKIPSIS
jgi:hypothetical protein